MAATARKSDFKLITDTQYLALTGEPWGVYYDNFEDNWPRYNGIALNLAAGYAHRHKYWPSAGCKYNSTMLTKSEWTCLLLSDVDMPCQPGSTKIPFPAFI